MNTKDEKNPSGEKIDPGTKDPEVISNIRNVLESQPFCVLCTQGEGQPYGSLIAFAYSEDLKQFFFITPQNTRKYTLLETCSNISLVIDTRSKNPDHMKEIEAVTITGIAKELKQGKKYDKGIKLLKERHPYMSEFQEAESTSLFRINVKRYLHVTRFQEVTQWVP